MLRSAREIVGYRVEALDAEFGDVEDFYFDDHSWKVRYIVVATGKWLPRRMVLISPEEAGDPDWERDVLPVSLSKGEVENSRPVVLSSHWIRRVHRAKHDVHVDLAAEQIEESPECDAPIDRGFEHEQNEHYDMPKYWQSPEEEPEDEG
ncbi:MAG: PRC-barrel domain-containing protein [Candidatus Brocadiia bacterium]